MKLVTYTIASINKSVSEYNYIKKIIQEVLWLRHTVIKTKNVP